MKVLKLTTFEGIEKPARGPLSVRDGSPGAETPLMAALASDTVKIYALPGGAFLVDWGDPGVQSGALSYVSASNVKRAIVVLDDAEKAKLLK